MNTPVEHHATAPWGEHAPSGLFASLLKLTRSGQNSVLARLTMWLAPKANDIETLGFKARLYPHDNLSEKRALLTPGRFDPAELGYLSDHLKPGFNFIDIGANCGVYTLHLANKADMASKFVAVEPQPEMLRRLQFNLAANSLSSVTVRDVAISDAPGQVTFHVNDSNRGESGLITDGEEITVKAITLLELMDTAAIERADAIKIDVEGAEMRILTCFFDQVPDIRWPDILVLESLYSNDERDPVALTMSKGYEIALDTGRNVILTR